MKLLALGGVTFASALGCHATPAARAPRPSEDDDFFFLQLSDTHWGYRGAANPGAEHTLRHAVRVINESALRPAFVMFTGDLVQTTDDDSERAARMRQFRDIVAELRVPTVRFIPGEHDAALDLGATYAAHFGELHYTFDHGGIHFIALDNASDPAGGVGEQQLAWLRDDLARVPADTSIVVFAHRPLFPLYPNWSWETADGGAVLALLGAHENVTVFYGHIHQQHHKRTGAINHYAARSLVFPLPAPGSAPARAPLPWNEAEQDHGLGYQRIRAHAHALLSEDVPLLDDARQVSTDQ